MRIGVLALQGSFLEHNRMLKRIEGVESVYVKKPEELACLDGLILPGGESTTMSRLLKFSGLFEPLKARIRTGLPVYGTCAGMILLADSIVGESPHLGGMPVTVRRNAYGRQIDSFETRAVLPTVSKAQIPLVFIRAPWIEQAGPTVDVLLSLNGHIVAAREKNILVTSFHPELTDDLTIHSYFAGMVKSAAK